MKIGLIQIDGKMPNLALMKLASWHRNKGDDVRIIDLSSLRIEKWYGSKIFMGGSGYDIKQKLPKEIEAQVPDYDLFNTNYSIGFTSRGCVKDCGFCIVKEKEGNLFECDFSKDIKHSKYIIIDNNFLASSLWKDKLRFFIDNNIKVCFTQGLDFDFIDDEKALTLSKVKYYDRSFTQRRIYFAFDNPSKEKIVREKLEILLQYINPRHIMVYVLVGYNTEFSQDMFRFKVLREYNVDPFIMIYNNRKDKPILRHFARWVNKRIYKAEQDFTKYDKLNNHDGGINFTQNPTDSALTSPLIIAKPQSNPEKDLTLDEPPSESLRVPIGRV